MYGRITGISGILNSVIKYDKGSGFHYKYFFILGLITIPKILQVIFYPSNNFYIGNDMYFRMYDNEDLAMKNTHIAAWFIGGFLTGIGVRMGNGCTSGHGVCGMPRFAIRSIVAVCTFMLTGFGLATLKYHVPFLNNGQDFGDTYYEVWRWLTLAIMILGHVLGGVFLLQDRKSTSKLKDYMWNYIFGLIFGLGLLISGMLRISKILTFLTIGSVWDPSLIFVMGSAVAINVFTFYFIQKRDKPMNAEKFAVPPRNGKVDIKLICGAALFGLGWGFAGLCPGPGLVNFFLLSHGLFWVVALFVGMIGHDMVAEYLKKRGEKKVNQEVSYQKTLDGTSRDVSK